MSRTAQTKAVKARLDPTLNEPYFASVRESVSCHHMQHGVNLDKVKQRAYCKKCGEEIALFDALWNYHHAEERLVGTLMALEHREKQAIERKQREKERRPFMRQVTGRVARKDMTLKTEPVVGWLLTLECGHKQEQKDTRHLKNVNCHQCRHAASTFGPKKP